MGIKDQFQDKANELKGKAQQARKGAKDEASERAQQLRDKKSQGQEKPDPARSQFDETDDAWDA
ncbi:MULTISPECIES: hypothetical protein [unclassified Streptomyces]|uniref:hypothetical protein n=1 Tax=unclassified Streptomyces TaxID=2593676 RepID=UPI001BEBD351|nr:MULTISPECIES: hypothetical protein [unclassified Streptomyces]MBT2408244.1 hypothetical protein [Streptomyces sp. ISL-21]MBT2458668.1 hypothetical protein [Streptomyces sp. ISL-86]MBT2607479.1 hypothetical protein [Streptomyces sp. ISL-87]